jgi:threonine dehydrogenase-like Zn-dependent dehydrogenase
VEPLAVAWHAIDMSGYQEGDWVLIIGGGPIGLAVLQCLKARGCDKIIVSEVGPQRLEYAKSFGANYVLDPTKVDLLARVREICDGQGAHVAFDAAGVQTGLEQAVLALRARGTLVNIAVWEKAPNFQVNNLVFRERKYLGVATYLDGDFQKVIDAIASGYVPKLLGYGISANIGVGKLKPELMITSKIPFNEVEEKGFKPLVNERDKHVKILVQVNP